MDTVCIDGWTHMDGRMDGGMDGGIRGTEKRTEKHGQGQWDKETGTQSQGLGRETVTGTETEGHQ